MKGGVEGSQRVLEVNIAGVPAIRRECGFAFGALAAYLVAGACSARASEAASADPVMLLLFGVSGEIGPPITFARRQGGANVCATTAGAARLFPGVGIASVTRGSPFQPYPELNGGGCDVRYHDRPVPPPEGGRTYRYERCALHFRTAAGSPAVEIAPLAPVGDDRFVLAECFYRLAMYIEGYRGALNVPTRSIFVETSRGFFAGQTRWVGPLATTIPIWLNRGCPMLARLYFRADFPDELRRQCRRER